MLFPTTNQTNKNHHGEMAVIDNFFIRNNIIFFAKII